MRGAADKDAELPSGIVDITDAKSFASSAEAEEYEERRRVLERHGANGEGGNRGGGIGEGR